MDKVNSAVQVKAFYFIIKERVSDCKFMGATSPQRKCSIKTLDLALCLVISLYPLSACGSLADGVPLAVLLVGWCRGASHDQCLNN